MARPYVLSVLAHVGQRSSRVVRPGLAHYCVPATHGLRRPQKSAAPAVRRANHKASLILITPGYPQAAYDRSRRSPQPGHRQACACRRTVIDYPLAEGNRAGMFADPTRDNCDHRRLHGLQTLAAAALGLTRVAVYAGAPSQERIHVRFRSLWYSLKHSTAFSTGMFGGM